MPRQYTLGKNERLKSRKQIEQLFNEGKKIAAKPLLAYYLFAEPQTNLSNQQAIPSQGLPKFPIRFGAGVSAKNFKKAVDRNRIKRLMREAYRLQKKELQEKLMQRRALLNLFFIFSVKELSDYKSVYGAVGVVLQKLLKEIERQSAK